jgi:hypothetical protein
LQQQGRPNDQHDDPGTASLPEADHPDGGNCRDFDLIDEFAVSGPGAWGTLATDAALLERVEAVERELLDTDRTWVFLTETIVNIWRGRGVQPRVSRLASECTFV